MSVMVNRLFACTKCGQVFEEETPDEHYQKASLDKDAYVNKLKVNYRCTKCETINSIYWGRY